MVYIYTVAPNDDGVSLNSSTLDVWLASGDDDIINREIKT